MIAAKPMQPKIHEHKEVRRFVKFCIVGLSSTIVQFAFLNLLYYRAHLPLIPSLTVAFILSVCNGFYWNRRWTFKESRQISAHEQYVRFLAVNVVAWLLNTSIVVLIIAHFANHGAGGLLTNPHNFVTIATTMLSGQGKKVYPPLMVNGSTLAAAGVVVFWNFFANRLWTFKH